MDAAGVEAAMQSFLPEVVIDELTSLPKRNTPEEMSAAAERNRRLKREGGRNIQNAARAAGVRRYIVQPCGFWYAPGDGLAVETDSFAFDGSPSIAAGTRMYAEVEQRVIEQQDMKGVALRYGFFYGPGTWYHREGAAADRARAQQLPLIGEGQGVWSFVHVEDAAAATVAALHCAPGVYNIVDDHPSPMRVWLPALARAVDAPPPPAQDTAGEDAVYYATRLRGASNAKAKRDLNFAPREHHMEVDALMKRRLSAWPE
jgi:2-alkyl-3-oxoalkanoate reductase